MIHVFIMHAAPRYKPIRLEPHDKKLTQKIIHLLSNGCGTFILHINTTNIKFYVSYLKQQ